MDSDNSEFYVEGDAILEAFVRSVIRGRLAEYHTAPVYACHGPKNDEDVPTVENLCDQPAVILTYVRGSAIAFCEPHLPILTNYLWHPVHDQVYDTDNTTGGSILDDFFAKYRQEK